LALGWSFFFFVSDPKSFQKTIQRHAPQRPCGAQRRLESQRDLEPKISIPLQRVCRAHNHQVKGKVGLLALLRRARLTAPEPQRRTGKSDSP
jgi:hypothetical protein